MTWLTKCTLQMSPCTKFTLGALLMSSRFFKLLHESRMSCAVSPYDMHALVQAYQISKLHFRVLARQMTQHVASNEPTCAGNEHWSGRILFHNHASYKNQWWKVHIDEHTQLILLLSHTSSNTKIFSHPLKARLHCRVDVKQGWVLLFQLPCIQLGVASRCLNHLSLLLHSKICPFEARINIPTVQVQHFVVAGVYVTISRGHPWLEEIVPDCSWICKIVHACATLLCQTDTASLLNTSVHSHTNARQHLIGIKSWSTDIEFGMFTTFLYFVILETRLRGLRSSETGIRNLRSNTFSYSEHSCCTMPCASQSFTTTHWSNKNHCVPLSVRSSCLQNWVPCPQ